MGVTRITTIAVGGSPAVELMARARRRRNVRRLVDWLVKLNPADPPVIRHAAMHQYWHITPEVRDEIQYVFGSPPIFAPMAFEVFMMPEDVTAAQIARRVRAKMVADQIRPAMVHVLDAVRLRAHLLVAIFTIMRPVGVSPDDADYDTAPAWRGPGVKVRPPEHPAVDGIAQAYLEIEEMERAEAKARARARARKRRRA
jgi:hypothetical protein